MRTLIIVGSISFLAGLGLGVVVPALLAPTPPSLVESAPAPTPAPAKARYEGAAFPDRPPQEEALLEAPPETPGPERDLARLDPPPGGEPPPWWGNREGGDGPPPEVRTNREAMMAWMADRRLERAQALRSNFVAKAELSENEAVRFDVLMASLNMRLKQQSEKWREALDNESMTRSEVRARAMSEISQAMVLTYDELDRNMPDGWREQAGQDFNLMTFVEPEVWHELRPVMRGSFRGGGPGRPGEPAATPRPATP